MIEVTSETSPATLDQSKNWVVGAAVFSAGLVKYTRLLLIKRAAHEESFAGMWELPDGGVENTDATISAAVSRELKEETGLEMTKILERNQDLTWVGQSGRTSVQINYLVDVKVDGPVRLKSGEHEDYRWCTAEEAKELAMTEEMRNMVKDAFHLRMKREDAV